MKFQIEYLKTFNMPQLDFEEPELTRLLTQVFAAFSKPAEKYATLS